MTDNDILCYIDTRIQSSKQRHHYRKTNREWWIYFAWERWTLGVIADEIRSNPHKPTITILEDFRDKMDDYACRAKTAQADVQFSTAYDITTDLLDWVISNERRC